MSAPLTVENWVVSGTTYDLNDATYVARLRLEDLPFRRSTGVDIVARNGRFPVSPGFDKQPIQLPFSIELKAVSHANIATLRQWFRDGTVGFLQVDFDGSTREVEGRVRRTVPYDAWSNKFGVVLDVMDPRWRLTTQDTTTEAAIASSGATWSVENDGSARADREVIEITPGTNKAVADDWIYKEEVIVANRVRRAFPNYALELTEGWDHAAEVTGTRSQSDGADVRVLEDGIEIPRWFGEHADNDANSAATKIWANVTLAPARIATLAVATTALDPADDGVLTVDKGDTDEFPDSGALLIDDEVITYTGKTLTTFTGIKRAERNTTAAVHAVDSSVYWIEKRYQIIHGNTGVAAPTARDDLKPLLDLTSNSVDNEQHEWIDFADDDNPKRSMGWARTLDPSRDSLADAILGISSNPASELKFEYQSDGAVAGKPNANQWSRPIPSGTGASGGNVASLTRVVDQTLALIAEGRDELGTRVLLETYLGALTSSSVNISEPASALFSFLFYARNQFAVSVPTGSGSGIRTMSTATSYGASTTIDMQFVAPADGIVTAIWLNAESNVTPQAQIWSDDGSDAPGFALSDDQAVDSAFPALGAGAGWRAFTLANPLEITAGTKYWIRFKNGTAGTTDVEMEIAAYQGNIVHVSGATIGEGEYPETALSSTTITPESFARDGIAVTDGDDATVDGLTIHLDTAAVPYVAMQAREDLYWLDAVLSNDTTGQTITFAIPCSLSDVIQVDVDARTVRNITTGENLFGLATFSDPEAWLYLEPGTNTLSWTEVGVAGVTVAVKHYDRWE